VNAKKQSSDCVNKIMLITDLAPAQAKMFVIFNLKFCQNLAMWAGLSGRWAVKVGGCHLAQLVCRGKIRLASHSSELLHLRVKFNFQKVPILFLLFLAAFLLYFSGYFFVIRDALFLSLCQNPAQIL